MKITKKIVKWFEQEQEQWGTEIALKNLIWWIAAELMHDIGVIRVRTSYAKKQKGQF